MAAGWMTQTLSAPSEGGGYSLLPAGLNNFTIRHAEIVQNKWNGRNELELTISSSEGGGKHAIPLEPWSADAIDTFLKVFNNGLGNIGIPVEGLTAQQVLAKLPTQVAGLVGNVIECNVLHQPRKPKADNSHLKDDGTPWLDAKCYINRLVSTGPAPTAQAAAPSSEMAALDAAFSAAPSFAGDDDIPF
jgi:hypothetical protein